MMRSVRTLWGSVDGAVAPTVALSLTALIAAGGIAFDYARVASMDTELQDGADQAALAAASQLDGQDRACLRAAAAASALVSNKTLMANDNTGTNSRDITIDTSDVSDCAGGANIKFYKSWNQDTDEPGDEADDDSNAKVVVVTVTPRQAVYALTPIVAAFRSGSISAQAVASLGSAICKMPPLMICNPQETVTNTTFDPSAFVGDGLRLTAVGGGSGSWAPGNFGYLDTGITGVNGSVNQLRAALGWNTPPGNCIAAEDVDTKPGATETVTDAINTRFDIYQNNNTSCYGSGPCSASINSLKDVRRPANGNNCKWGNGGQGWQFDTSGTGYYGQNVPTTASDLPTTTTPSAMGHPRDECHAVSQTGNCTGGRMGDGNWDRDAYFRTNYVRSVASAGGAVGTAWTAAQWKTNTGLSPTVPRLIAGTTTPNPAYASRYNVYQWEIAHRDTVVDGVTVLGPRNPGASGNTLVAYGKPQCSPSQGYGAGQVPDATTPDRRRISVAVVNCLDNDVKGNSTNVPVEEWIDVFLVEPSLNRARTSDGDLYAEVIDGAVSGGNGPTAGQVIRHDVPYLIK